MMLTKGAIGNLINRYSAVLKKCSLMNTFGSLAVAGMLVAGGVSGAWAEGTTPAGWDNTQVVANNTTLSGTYQGFAQTNETLAGVATVDYATTGVSVANNAKFINNSMTASSAGGALKLLNGITIGQNVEFSGNKATGSAWGGGAIYIKLANGKTASATQTVTIDENAIFKGNIATSLGGAIALEYGQLEIKKGASFTNNSATTAGGAIAVWTDTNDHAYNTTTNTLTLTDATFTSNTAGTNAVTKTESQNAVTKTESQSAVANVDGSGGAVFLAGAGTNTFTGTTFEGNKALGENGKGGAVYMAGRASATFDKTTFTGNSASGANGIGGAAFIATGTTSTFAGGAFTNNSATGSAGAVENRGIVTFTNVDFDGNTAGVGNAQGGWGGAVRTVGADSASVLTNFVITDDLTYSGNTATVTMPNNGYTDRGGFLYMYNGRSTVGFDVADGKTLTIGDAAAADSTTDSIVSTFANDSVINKTGKGTLTVNGSMKAYTGAIDVTEGTLNMATGFGEYIIGIQSRLNGSTSGNAAVAGFAASEMTIADGASVNMGDLNITFTEIQNTDNTEDNKNAGTKVSVADGGSFKAGAVNVGQHTYTKVNENFTDLHKITTTGWGEFNIAGSAKATIDSLTVNADGAKFDKTGAGVLHVGADDGGVITVGSAKAENAAELNVKNGELRADKLVLGSREKDKKTFGTVNIGVAEAASTNGTLVVNSIEDYNGTLTLTNGRLSVKDGWTIKATGQAKKNFIGGTLEVLGTGLSIVDLATGNTLMIGSNTDSITMDSNLITTVLNAGSADLVLANGATAGNGFDKGVVTLFGDGKGNFLTANSLAIGTTGAAGIVNLGDSMEQHADKVKGGTTSAAITVAAANSSLNVNAGKWTVASLDVKAGAANINNGTLAISTSLKSFAAGSGSAGINVGATGVLKGGYDVFFDATKLGGTLAGGLNKLNVAAGGSVVVDAAGKTLALADTKTFSGNLITGNGSVQYDGAAIAIVKDDYSTVEGLTDTVKVGSVAGNATLLKDVTVGLEDTTIAEGKGFHVGSLKVKAADNVTVALNDNVQLVGTNGTLASSTSTDSTKNKVNFTVANNKTLTFGSSAVQGTKASLKGDVTLGTSTTGATLNATNGDFTVAGDIIAGGENKGTLNVTGGNLNVTGGIGGTTSGNSGTSLNKVNADGGNIVVDGALHSHTVTASGGNVVANNAHVSEIVLDNGGTLKTDKLVMYNKSDKQGATITVGSTEGGAGTLVVTGEANLKGASLFLDPAWKGNDELKDASKAVLNFKDSKIDGLLTAGQNSFIVLGDSDSKWAENAFQNSGLKWGKDDVTAALFVKSSQSLDQTNGGILVDGKIDAAAFATGATNKATANTAEFRANSLLAVNASSMTEKAALVGATGSSSVLTVNAGSKLLIVGGKANDTVKIVSDFKGAGSKIDSTSWSGANLTTDSKLLTATAGTFAEGKYDVTLSQNNTRSIFPKLDKNMAGLVDGMVKQIGLDPMSENYGQRFVSRAVSDSYIGSNDTKEAAATIEGAAKMAFAGAAPQMGMNLANAAGNIAGLRNSLSAAPQGAVVALNADGTSAQEGLSAGDGMKNGFGLWVMPTYQNQQGFGFESGDFETGYKSNAAGVALGADYTFNDMFRVGAQFNVGGGYAESTGDFNSTDNRFNYWGLGLYAGYQYQNFGLTADFGYSANNNELEQSLPSAMQMAKLKADAKTDTITAGLRGEYKITTDAMDIVPHIGVRMTNMHMDSFNVKSDKHKVFKADDMNATVWTFPVGVTFSKDIETSNGWTVKPSLDLAIVPAAGDIEAKQDIKIVGVNGTASMESNIMDAISYQGSLGLSAKNDNGVSVGVNYTLQAGAHTTDHGVQATFRYEF